MESKPLRILLVDDHQDTVSALQRILSHDGFTVTPALSMESALTLARGNLFDVLITDIGLSGADGCDLLAEVRKLYSIHAIAMSGYGMPDDVQRMKEAGFDDFLIKPVKLENLTNAILQASLTIFAADERSGRLTAPTAKADLQDPHL